PSSATYTLSLHDALPISSIAQAMGIEVVADPFLDHSGHYQRNGGSPRIIFNSSEPPVRQRFTVAHELGHHVNGDIDAPRDTAAQDRKSTRLNSSHVKISY